MRFLTQPRRQQAGFAAIGYIIASAILMIALTAALTLTGGDTGANVEISSLTNKLRGQISLITLKINDCLTTYPGAANNSETGTYFQTYPAHDVPGGIVGNPDSLASFMDIKQLECPGARENFCAGAGDSDVCSKASLWLFQGPDSDVPIVPSGFSGWTYQNQPQWVAIKVEAPASGWPLKALRKLDTGDYAEQVRVCADSDPPYALYVFQFYDDGGGIDSIDVIPCQ